MDIANSTEVPIIYDLSLTGGADPYGHIKDVWGADALNNAIKMWIASYRGEAIRNPNSGGYITQWLMKPMNEANIPSITMSIKDGIEQDFSPSLTINAVTVTPNYVQRYWKIYLDVYSSDLKIRTQVSANIKNQV